MAHCAHGTHINASMSPVFISLKYAYCSYFSTIFPKGQATSNRIVSEQNTPHLKKGLWKTMTENSLFVFLVCLGSLRLLERCARMTPQLFTFSFIFISMAFVSWDYYCHLESPEIVQLAEPIKKLPCVLY